MTDDSRTTRRQTCRDCAALTSGDCGQHESHIRIMTDYVRATDKSLTCAHGVSLCRRVDDLVKRHGSLRRVARMLALDAGYLSYLRSGHETNPSADVLRKLGLRRVVVYVETRDGDKQEATDVRSWDAVG